MVRNFLKYVENIFSIYLYFLRKIFELYLVEATILLEIYFSKENFPLNKTWDDKVIYIFLYFPFIIPFFTQTYIIFFYNLQ